MFKFITHRPLWLNIVTGIALAIGLFCLVILSLNWFTNHSASKTVPYVLGKSYEDAEKLLTKAGFEVVIQDSVYTDTTKPLAVLKQVPDADEVVKVNRTVYLTINRAVPPMVEMPNIVGYSYRSAEMVLMNAGLKPGDTTFKPDFAKNSILEQRFNGQLIAAGTQVRMGSRIDMVLGDGVGNQQIVVPNLIGKTYEEARVLLEAYGISFASVMATGVTDTVNAFIYKQTPERMREDHRYNYIRPGQTIDIWLQTERPALDSLLSMPDEPNPE